MVWGTFRNNTQTDLKPVPPIGCSCEIAFPPLSLLVNTP